MTGPDELSPDERERRRRKLAGIFGDVLPDQTTDDTDSESAGSNGTRADEEWLRRQVPPHHGG